LTEGGNNEKTERKIEDPEIIEALLERTLVGRIATINRKRFPVIKPINFLYWDGKLYFHSSKKGEKIADIRRGSPVCFEMDHPVAYAVAKGRHARRTISIEASS